MSDRCSVTHAKVDQIEQKFNIKCPVLQFEIFVGHCDSPHIRQKVFKKNQHMRCIALAEIYSQIYLICGHLLDGFYTDDFLRECEFFAAPDEFSKQVFVRL